MSYKIEGKDIVIQGFEEGIADTPYKGIGDMRNVNNSSVPMEASVAFRTVSNTPDEFSGSFTTSGPYVPELEVLVVAGGGGGSTGGGGAGGLVYSSTHVVNKGSYNVVVGAGGAGEVNNADPGEDGEDSSFDTLVATGGGGGATNVGAGVAGGSGGGGGNSVGGAGTMGQGNDGGSANNSFSGGGGGGGAGATGDPGVTSFGGGDGGDGLEYSISGTPTYYAGGGGGAPFGGAIGAGGAGGGGQGNNGAGGDATANTGGGGGGGGGSAGATGGSGASGIVIISYDTGDVVATGGTITTSGGKTIHTFLSNGVFEITDFPNVGPLNYTVSTGTIFDGRAVVLSGGSLPPPLTAGPIYFIGDVDTINGTFNFYTSSDLELEHKVFLEGSGSGTMTGFTMGIPTYFATQTVNSNGIPIYRHFCVDDNGLVWYRNDSLGTWVYLANTELTGAYGNGLGVYRGYLFVWRSAYIDYLPLGNTIDSSLWVYEWYPPTGGTGLTISNLGAPDSPFSHETITATDNAMYSCDGPYIQSFIQIPGEVFDPTDNTTYTWSQQALALPPYDSAQSLAELGTNLLIGGSLKAIYPWDRVSTSFNYPILIADSFVRKMVTLNNNTYIFAGRRGKIYITNGSQAEEWKKIPDFLSGTVEPYYEWGGAAINRDDIYFGVKATTNDGTAINQYGGLWAANTKTNSLRLLNKLSYDTYAGMPTAISVINQNYQTAPALGYSLYIGWEDGTGGGGIDTYDGEPYTAGQSYIDSDMIPIGTFLDPFTPSQLEWKVSVPLVAGESVALYYRTDLNGSFTLIPTETTSLVGQVSDLVKANFQKAQWLQIRAVLTSTETNPTYTRLTEIRIRDFPS